MQWLQKEKNGFYLCNSAHFNLCYSAQYRKEHFFIGGNVLKSNKYWDCLCPSPNGKEYALKCLSRVGTLNNILSSINPYRGQTHHACFHWHGLSIEFFRFITESYVDHNVMSELFKLLNFKTHASVILCRWNVIF